MQCRRQLAPALPDTIAKFFDAATKPPKGGWHFTLGELRFDGSNESEVMAKVKKWRQNNLTFVSDIDIEREVWAYWCARQPERCFQRGEKTAPALGTIKPAELTKQLQGPPIWTFLNTLAVVWEPGLHPLFLNLCDSISVILQCPVCRFEWQSILRTNRPTNLASRLEVCRWVNDVHNQVNRSAGKPAYPYEQMVSQWGAPLP